MSRTRNGTIGVAFALVLSGCTASRVLVQGVTPELQANATGDELRSLSLSVVTPSDKDARYQIEQFVKILRQAQIFRSVSFDSETKAADLVLNDFVYQYPIVGRGFQCFEPYLLILTVGIIPQHCEWESNLSFTIHPHAGSGEIRVRDAFVHETVLGWMAGPMRLAPSWGGSDAMVDYLRVLFLTRRVELLAIAHSNNVFESGPPPAAAQRER